MASSFPVLVRMQSVAPRALGQIVIVDVGDRISVGLVTLSVQEMNIGDLVMMQASR